MAVVVLIATAATLATETTTVVAPRISSAKHRRVDFRTANDREMFTGVQPTPKAENVSVPPPMEKLMQHWLDRLTDLAAIPGANDIVKHGLAEMTEQLGFVGYAYVNIQPGHSVVVSNYG